MDLTDATGTIDDDDGEEEELKAIEQIERDEKLAEHHQDRDLIIGLVREARDFVRKSSTDFSLRF
jgi:hypothetical protein